MSWWSTLLGGAFGYMIGGPIGALIGASLGSSLGGSTRRFGPGPSQADWRGRANPHQRAQVAFFAATFGVMGHVAKADGTVSAEEIRLANRVMGELGLGSQQRQTARALFDEGKSPRFPLDDVLDQLRSECLRGSNIRRMFLEIQFQAAWADGGIHPNERRILRHIATRLGLSEADFIQVERMMGFRRPGKPGRPLSRRGLCDPGRLVERAGRRCQARLPPLDEPSSSRQACRQGSAGGNDARGDRAHPTGQGGVGERQGGARGLTPAGQSVVARSGAT